MKGMILAAGLGTRLRPLTWTLPKPMVPLCNRPLVDWAVESFLGAGISELVVNLHYLPEAIESHLTSRYASRASLAFSFEPEILGTGGALRRVRPLLEDAGEFFVVNGDTVQFPRYHDLRDARRRAEAIAALTLRHAPDGDRFTPVWLDQGRLTGFGAGTGEALMFSGSHFISTRLFERFPDREVFGIVDAVYQPILSEGREAIAAIVDDGLWFDVGTPQRYLAASTSLLSAMERGVLSEPAGSSLRDGSLFDDTAFVRGNATASVAGARSRVDGVLRESILWEDCVVGRGVTLERCIVGSGVVLDRPGRWQDAIICRDSPGIPADVPREDGLVVVRQS
jgi:NDP-sugar pyrophosphorylase family protein